MWLAELWAEALQQPDLLVGQADLPLGGGLFQAQQAVVRHIAEVGGKLEQPKLAPCYLLVRGHVALRRGLMLFATPS